MTQPNTKYETTRTCNQCGHEEKLQLTKREAAFELVRTEQLLGKTCPKCQSSSFTTGYPYVMLDYELLLEWATDLNLELLPQDEDLVLADELYLDMMLQILDTVAIPDYKRDQLMSALCVIVYDNTRIEEVGGQIEGNKQLVERVIAELNKRIDKLRLADAWIMDYIKETVYPQLDFTKNKTTSH